MNWKNLMKNSFTLLLMILISFQTVQSITITRPFPYDLALLRGESARFNFQLQATTSTDKLSCSYSITGLEPLEIKFDDENTIVNAGGVADVYGTVTVPQGASLETYSGSLAAKCGAIAEEGIPGSAVYQSISGPIFTVKVVETKEEKSVREISEVKQPGISYLAIITIIIVVILLASGVYYWSTKRKKINKMDTSGHPSSGFS